MFNLKYILIISLISFTLQDSHCLVTSSACYDKEPTNNAGGIANCKEAGEGVCYECVYGFALSSNQKSCISFQNCDNLAEGDKTCKECAYNFHLNSKGQCERSLCEHYDEESGICKSCYPGYYLKNKECKKINIPHCLEVDELDEKKCTRCLKRLSEPVDGKCIAPKTWVIGCKEYDTEGKCTKCKSNYTLKDGQCNFNSCDGKKKVEYCDMCEAGFTDENNNMGLCIGFDGTKDETATTGIHTETDDAKRIKFQIALMVIMLVIAF